MNLSLSKHVSGPKILESALNGQTLAYEVIEFQNASKSVDVTPAFAIGHEGAKIAVFNDRTQLVQVTPRRVAGEGVDFKTVATVALTIGEVSIHQQLAVSGLVKVNCPANTAKTTERHPRTLRIEVNILLRWLFICKRRK